jgi:sugar lactone lactonase YvrE
MRPMVLRLEDRSLLSAPTVTSLGVSAASITYGQTEVLTATVTTDPPGGVTPTGGTVRFMDESTALGTEPLAAGTATFTTAGLGAGTHELAAVYGGDPDFGGSSSLARASTFTTVAGDGTLGYTGDGGPATAAEIGGPFGMALDQHGHLFFADSDNNVIREVDLATGLITTVVGDGTSGFAGDGGPATAAELYVPQGVAVDDSGHLFIADTSNNRVREVDLSTGVITTVAGDGNAGETGDGGPATSAELLFPAAVAVDHSGHLFIADSGGISVREVDLATGAITTVAGGARPTTAIYSGPATGIGLSSPFGLAADHSGHLFIADTYNDVIREVDLATGLMTTVVGTGDNGDTGDGGPPADAELSDPDGLAIDSSGDLFIATGVIREAMPGPDGLLADGTITTIAGDAASAAVVVDPYGDLFTADKLQNVIGEAKAGSPREVTVAPAPLTITAVSQTMAAGQTVPTLTATFSGFVDGDTAASLGTPPVLSTTATSASPPGTYPIDVSGASSPNYAIRFVDGTLTVVPPPAGPGPNTPTATAPLAAVEQVSIRKIKTGKKKAGEVIVVQFNESVNAADAQNIGAYSLATVAEGKKHRSKAVPLASASYDASTFAATLTTRRPLVLSPPIRLTVESASLLDDLGRPLQGGADFQAILSKGGSTIASAVRPGQVD